ncbi:unnamed protein product [Dibothriocephalus latus]|uniref:Ubiquitin-like domain-containing protein n=1 Tax=Dibothriocephalus latus TaxID=60516 RepID=A0A3P7LI57_DIBLA|nr:unnamed protein product [Dibothriocephalus latus]
MKTGIPQNMQKLTYDGIVLEDFRQLKEYGISQDVFFVLGLPLNIPELTALNIKKPDGGWCRYWICEDETAMSLKERMAFFGDGWPVESYELLFNGEILRESQTLKSWEIVNDSVLQMTPFVDEKLKI